MTDTWDMKIVLAATVVTATAFGAVAFAAYTWFVPALGLTNLFAAL